MLTKKVMYDTHVDVLLMHPNLLTSFDTVVTNRLLATHHYWSLEL